MKPHDEDARYAQLAAQALAEDDGAPSQTSLGDRAVAAIERALRLRSPASRRSTWLGAGLAAAAAVVLGVIGWTTWLGPRLTAMTPPPIAVPAVPPPRPIVATIGAGEGFIEEAGTDRLTIVGTEVAIGARMRSAARSSLTLAISTGTKLRLGGASAARVTELGAVQRFALESGEIDADVAKLESGQRFLIATPDAEIEVKGTRFEVVIGSEPSRCGIAARTRVFVREGVVAVRSGGAEVHVSAGSSWPQSCEEPPPRHAGAKHRHGTKTVVAEAAAPPVANAPAASTLAEQNDLFAAALSARSRGDVDGAIRWLDELLARFPTGQLVDSARAERRRLLSKAAQGERPE